MRRFYLCIVMTLGLGVMSVSWAQSAQETPVPQLSSRQHIYQQKCGFCHTPKAVTALPNLQAWIRLLYTSACPDVSIQLNEAERQAIKTHFQEQYRLLEKSQP